MGLAVLILFVGQIKWWDLHLQRTSQDFFFTEFNSKETLKFQDVHFTVRNSSQDDNSDTKHLAERALHELWRRATQQK